MPQLSSDPVELIRTLRQFVGVNDPPRDPDVSEHDIDIPARDGQAMRAIVYEPAKRDDTPLPLLVLFYGGGYCLGSPEAIRIPAQFLIKNLPAVIVAPTYRLAPEHVFPTAVNDAWDALQYLAKNASAASINADPTKGFVVGGISAGAGLTNVVSHLAKDTPLAHPLTGVWSCCASNCPPQHVPERFRARYLSRSLPSRDPVLRPDFHAAFMANYHPDFDSPLHASFIWPSGHTGLPRTYVQICGMEYSRDEALIYADVLQNEAGVETRVDLYKGLPHCFWSMYKTIAATKQWEQDTIDGFAWLLMPPNDSSAVTAGSRFVMK